MTLFDVIETTRFSDAGTAMFAALADKSAPEETSLVVLAAAAAILAREAVNEYDLHAVCGEFAEVAEEIRLRLNVMTGAELLVVPDFTQILKEA